MRCCSGQVKPSGPGLAPHRNTFRPFQKDATPLVTARVGRCGVFEGPFTTCGIRLPVETSLPIATTLRPYRLSLSFMHGCAPVAGDGSMNRCSSRTGCRWATGAVSQRTSPPLTSQTDSATCDWGQVTGSSCNRFGAVNQRPAYLVWVMGRAWFRTLNTAMNFSWFAGNATNSHCRHHFKTF